MYAIFARTQSAEPREDSCHGCSLDPGAGWRHEWHRYGDEEGRPDKRGFYRHFASKDDLLVEAVARAFDEMGTGMLEAAKSAPEGQALRAIIERYLSTGHANSPGMGCV